MRQLRLALCAQALKLALQRSQCRVNHRAAEDRTLRLKRGESSFDRGDGIAHRASVA